MAMVIVSKRATRQQADLVADGYMLIDVTSTAENETFRKFSPFYPHGNIPIPKMNRTSWSVEGVWQGLKVFENEGIDQSKFDNKTMKLLKRPVNAKRGKILGHKYGDEISSYVDARKNIYIPTYKWVAETYLKNEIELLRGLINEGGKIAFVDYDTNCDIENTKKPLAHASIIMSII